LAIESQFVIGDQEAEEIAAFCRIAKTNKSMLTLSEVLQVTSFSVTEEDLETAWEKNASLNSRYILDSGWIMERSTRPEEQRESAMIEKRNREKSTRNLHVAQGFAALCLDKRTRLLAVSGGNSYLSARAQDDIDFFCVTADDSLWVFMLRALILARVYTLTRRGESQFCFSYVVDEKRAFSEFVATRDGLFARDALMARVLFGSELYFSLLKNSKWMSKFFPKLYGKRISESGSGHETASKKNGSIVLNSFLYYTLGTYIRMKAFLLNRSYNKSGNQSAVFHLGIGKDHCVYESNRYRRLRKAYASLEGET
jgi:hypothetical protein